MRVARTERAVADRGDPLAVRVLPGPEVVDDPWQRLGGRRRREPHLVADVVGADAVEPLLAKYESVADPAVRPFVLYALGKIDSPRVAAARG